MIQIIAIAPVIFFVLGFSFNQVSRSIPLPGLLWLPGLRLSRRRDLGAYR